MNIDVVPGDIELPGHFFGTALGNFEAEMVARNVAIMSKVGAWVAGEDTWLPFSVDDYRQFRALDNPAEPVGYKEMNGFDKLVREGYLTPAEDGSNQLKVSSRYLGIVAAYAKK